METKELTPGAWVYVGLYEGKRTKIQHRVEQQNSIPNIAMRAVCVSFGAKPEEVVSHSRVQNLSFARHAYCLMVRKFTKLTLKDIGKLLGNRDHATVVHSCRTADNLIQYDEHFRQMYDEALELLIDECGLLAHVYQR